MIANHPTALVAEDEDTLRSEIVERLGTLWPELTVVGEAADGLQALQLTDELRPDILFLDIQMPGATGLEVAHQVAGRTHIVFITAYDQHALQAFEHGAVDYLLKPLVPARLFAALTRLRERLAGPPPPTHALLDALAAATGTAAPPLQRAPLRWINASVGNTLRVITVDEVLYFESDNKYTRVVVAGGEALIRKSLKELLDELDPQQFWQIHRSTVVNAAAIAAVTRDYRGRLQVQLKQGDEVLQVANSHAYRFKTM
ncbi:MAG: LytTR family DNA-binding domain-containing protein [Rubrivivax sp.]|nr:LytTR family DNA-binding domain-containing protein [Rubrivivax sp.]